MRINRNHGREIGYLQFPDRFWRAEFFVEVDVANLLHTLGQYLRRTANAVKINTAVILACG